MFNYVKQVDIFAMFNYVARSFIFNFLLESKYPEMFLPDRKLPAHQ